MKGVSLILCRQENARILHYEEHTDSDRMRCIDFMIEAKHFSGSPNYQERA